MDMAASRPVSTLAAAPSFCPLPLPELCEGERWAEREFGHAQLHDERRSRRLVRIADLAAHQPAAAITQICANLRRDVDATYKFFENPRVSADAIAHAHHVATALRCSGFDFVFFAVDGSSFSLPDADGVGSLGPHKAGGKGLKTMLGLAVSPDGVPLGVLGQRVWARSRSKKKDCHRRGLNDKETKYWHEVLCDGQDVMAEHAPGVRLWAQLDREADSWTVVLRAVRDSEAHWTTIRAKANRNLVADPDGADETEPGGKLFDALESTPVGATWQMAVSGSAERTARTATMHLRWVEVTLKLQDKRTGARHPAPVFALLATEVGTTPEGEKPLHWLLLTTHRIDNTRDACLVLHGYALRWRVEGLHAALKDRGCRLEDSELGSKPNLERFLAVMVAVGVRLMRSTYLGRVSPEKPATLEYSTTELQALLLAHDRDPEEAASLAIGEAVVLLGKLGGHVGNPNQRPIGFKVLARGLKELRPWVRMVQRGLLERLR